LTGKIPGSRIYRESRKGTGLRAMPDLACGFILVMAKSLHRAYDCASRKTRSQSATVRDLAALG